MFRNHEKGVVMCNVSLVKRVGYFGFSLIIMAMVFSVPSGQAADLDVVILSGPSGGTFEVVASAISEIIRKKAPGVMASPEPGRGGLNVKMVEAKKGEMGVDLNNILFDAVNANAPYKKAHKDVRTIMHLYPNYYQLFALKEANIKGVKDLVGKRFVPASPGSNPYIANERLLRTSGLTFKDIEKGGGKVVISRWKDALQGMKDRNIDAIAWVTSAPQPGIMDVAMTRKLDFISIPDADLDRFLKKYPMYTKGKIPANTYSGQTEPTQTFVGTLVLIVHKDVPEDAVYNITKALWENRQTLGRSHPSLKYISEETVIESLNAPLHPGAKRYWKEAGIFK